MKLARCNRVECPSKCDCLRYVDPFGPATCIPNPYEFIEIPVKLINGSCSHWISVSQRDVIESYDK